jgi:hypothetical protein
LLKKPPWRSIFLALRYLATRALPGGGLPFCPEQGLADVGISIYFAALTRRETVIQAYSNLETWSEISIAGDAAFNFAISAGATGPHTEHTYCDTLSNALAFWGRSTSAGAAG